MGGFARHCLEASQGQPGRAVPRFAMKTSRSRRRKGTDVTGELSHFDESGSSRMVDVGAKDSTRRMARASGLVRVTADTLRLIRDRRLAKGDVLAVAQLAGIMAAKRTGELIPLCHPLPLDSVAVVFGFPDDETIRIDATVGVTARTGVEMEALTAVSVAALTVYDMLKAAQKDILISDIRLLRKTGGKSGDYTA